MKQVLAEAIKTTETILATKGKSWYTVYTHASKSISHVYYIKRKLEDRFPDIDFRTHKEDGTFSIECFVPTGITTLVDAFRGKHYKVTSKYAGDKYWEDWTSNFLKENPPVIKQISPEQKAKISADWEKHKQKYFTEEERERDRVKTEQYEAWKASLPQEQRLKLW